MTSINSNSPMMRIILIKGIKELINEKTKEMNNEQIKDLYETLKLMFEEEIQFSKEE